MNDITYKFIFLIILLILSALFSSAETAYTAVNRIQVQILAEGGDKKAKRVIWILDNKTKMLSAILIGNNVVNISASALTTILTIDLFDDTMIGVTTGLLTLVLLILGEIFPKTLANSYSLRISTLYSFGVKYLMIILMPLIYIVDGIRKGLMFVFKIEENPDEKMTEDEFMGYVDEGREKGAIEDDEFEMINNVFALDTSLARDIMIPRPDIVYVELGSSYEEFLKIYQEHNFTRYPVYNGNRDNIVGIVNVKDLLTLPENEEFFIGKIMREPHFTFEHKEVGTLLIEMRKNAVSLEIVLDEYGAVSGIITLEDILEEIVGEIRDEFDADERDSIKVIKEGTEYLLDGSTNLDDINEKLDINLLSEEYDSIGGFVIEQLDRLPKSGERIDLPEGIRLIIEVVRKNRVEKVHLIINKEREEEE